MFTYETRKQAAGHLENGEYQETDTDNQSKSIKAHFISNFHFISL